MIVTSGDHLRSRPGSDYRHWVRLCKIKESLFNGRSLQQTGPSELGFDWPLGSFQQCQIRIDVWRQRAIKQPGPGQRVQRMHWIHGDLQL